MKQNAVNCRAISESEWEHFSQAYHSNLSVPKVSGKSPSNGIPLKWSWTFQNLLFPNFSSHKWFWDETYFPSVHQKHSKAARWDESGSNFELCSHFIMCLLPESFLFTCCLFQISFLLPSAFGIFFLFFPFLSFPIIPSTFQMLVAACL